MAKGKSEKMLLFESVKVEVAELLKPLDAISFGGGELYIVDEAFYQKLMFLEDKLAPFKTETRRGSIFSINTFVAILNPGKIAISYHLTMATKSKLVTDRNKILDRLEGEKEISKNTINKITEERIELEELESSAADEERRKALKKIADEEAEFEKISKNPDDYDIIISTFKERKPYPQVNFKYIGQKEVKGKNGKIEECMTQISTNKHISIEKPSILVYDENASQDAYRSDMQVARFIAQGYRALGNVFVKPRKKKVK